MMTNKPLKTFIREERGTLSGFPLILLTAFLVAAVLGLLARWFLGSSPVSTTIVSRPTAVAPEPSSVESPVSKAADDEALFKGIEAELQERDLTKLQLGTGSIKSSTVDGKTVATHLETYRLPDLYTADQLAVLLGQTASSLGASLIGPVQSSDQPGIGRVYSALYAGGSKYNAVQIDWVATSKPRICLIIDDGGYQKGPALDALYDFKVPVTCSLIPHTRYSHFFAEDFPQHGVEVMCHLPMEGRDRVKPGDYQEYLKKGMDPAKAKQILERGLSDLPNCKGLNNHMGSVATTDLRLMEAVCEELKDKNMFVIDSKTSPQAVVSQAAKVVGVPVAAREFFLDNQKTPGTVLHEMKLTAAYAKKHGLAVAIGHFNVITLKTLKVEVQKLESQGFQFVYASEVVHQP